MVLEHYKTELELAQYVSKLEAQVKGYKALCERLQAQADEMRGGRAITSAAQLAEHRRGIPMHEQTSNEFTANDMASARAEGFRDGVASVAAQSAMTEQMKMDAERARVVDSMCMTWRHDFGMDRRDDVLGSCGMTADERDALRRQMNQLYDHHVAPLIQARASLPVGVTDASELQRVIYSADAAAKRMLDTDSFWWSEIASIRVEFERFMRTMLAAAPSAPAAEPAKCDCPGGSKPNPAVHAPNCPVRKASSLPAGSAVEEVEVVAWTWQGTLDRLKQGNCPEGEAVWPSRSPGTTVALMTVAQHQRIVAARDAAIEEWSGTAVQNGMEVDRLRAELRDANADRWDEKNAALSGGVRVPEWISVVERLPSVSEPGRVLILTNTCGVMVASRGGSVGIDGEFEDGWMWDVVNDISFAQHEVTHWMPIDYAKVRALLAAHRAQGDNE